MIRPFRSVSAFHASRSARAAAVRVASLSLVLLLAGCSATRLKLPPAVEIPEQVGPMVVVLEPFFEETRLQQVTRQERMQVNDGRGFPTDVTVARQFQEKPFHARPDVLAEEWRLVLAEVQRLRPTWRVVSTGTVPVLGSGPVVMVRTVLGEAEVVESNRMLKTVAAYTSFLLLPLFYAVPPVEETQRVVGQLSLYTLDAATAKERLLRYPSQPDFAVDTRGLRPRMQPFGLDVPYEEGVMAGDQGRGPVLVEGLARQLAVAVVALVEGVR